MAKRTRLKKSALGKDRGLTKRQVKFIAFFALGCAFVGGYAVLSSYEEPNSYSNIVLPDYAYRTQTTLETYTIATQIPDVLEKIPCYCNCIAIGHKSLKNCFISESGEFSPHGANCLLCMEEALDVNRWYKEGVSLKEIRERIDEKYGVYGPGTDTPLV